MFSVLWLPHFRLQTALRWREELQTQPVVIVDDRSNKGTVLEANALAEASGVRVGLPSVQALARCSALTLLPAQPAEEKAVQSTLLEVAHSLSPEVEDSAPGWVTLNLRGVKIGEWQPWCDSALASLGRLKLEARIGVAPNPDLAWLAAQKAANFLVVASPESFLHDLAISSIEPSPTLQSVLHDWGIHTLGQLTSLPRGDLGNRLGPEVEKLWQRAAGKTERLLRPVRAAEIFQEAFDFESEIETVEPLLFILRRFLGQMAQRLELTHRVAAKMTLTLLLEGGQSHQRDFTIPAPTGDEATLFRILHTYLEGLELQERIGGVRLLIEPALPDHEQFRLFEAPLRDANRFAETLARLIALVGPGNVGTAKVADTHQPESFVLESPQFAQARETTPETAPSRAIGLPLTRFRPPLAAQVSISQHQPVRVVSEKAHGLVVEAMGPYRVSGGWWDGGRWSAEEWDVEIQGEGLFRLSRSENEWSIAGSYDA